MRPVDLGGEEYRYVGDHGAYDDPRDGHPCGHERRTCGCGGCDPGAIEFVIDDATGRAVRCVWPDGDAS